MKNISIFKMDIRKAKKVAKHILTAGSVAIISAFTFMAPTQASAETRTLKLHYVHTGERAEITFKKNGRYLSDGLQKLNVFLRDWRRNEPTKMDPRLFDVVWQIYKSTGSSNYITVVSAYRSPATNSMLRSKTSGVAKNSQHTVGRAMDFFIPGVPVRKLRDLGLRFQAGGVGYYPKSGSPFVHIDVGTVRHWPRMNRKELLAVFPNGNTVHVPSDGKPLPGYKEALAAVERRKSSGGNIVVASASASTQKKSKTLFGALFGGGADEEEDNNDEIARRTAPTPARATARTAPAAPARPVAPQVVPVPAPPAAVPAPAPEQTIIAALPERAVPLPQAAPRPEATVAATPSATNQPEQNEQPENLPFAMASAYIPLPVSKPSAQLAAQDAIAALAADTSLAEQTPETVAMAAPAADNEITGKIPLPASRPMLEPHVAEQQIAAILPENRPSQTRENDAIADLVNNDAHQADTNSAQNTQITSAQTGELIAPPKDEYDLAEEAASADISKAEPVIAQPAPIPAPAPTPAKQAEQPVQIASLQPTAHQIPSSLAGATQNRVAVKGAKPRSNNNRKPRSAVIQPATKVTQLAISADSVTNTVPETNPVLKNDAMRLAPTMVYTAGFQQDGPDMDRAHSFKGNAVTFLTVAKFESDRT